MYHNGKEYNLEQYVQERKKEYESLNKRIPWEESEEYIWCVQEYLSCMGELNDEDRKFLEKHDPELLSLDDELREEMDEWEKWEEEHLNKKG